VRVFFFCVASEGEEAAARVDDAVLRGDWWLLWCGGLASKLLRNPAEGGGQARTPPPRHACARTRSTICQSTPPEFPTQPREARPPDRIERPRGGGPRAAPCTPTRRGGGGVRPPVTGAECSRPPARRARSVDDDRRRKAGKGGRRDGSVRG
jgi:hypothetical protein